MRIDDILDAIGEVDEVLVRGAKEVRGSHKTLWVTLGSLAACLLILFMYPIVFISMKGASSADPSAPSQNDGENDAIGRTEVSIYYVEDGEIAVDKVEWLQIREFFNAWRDTNGLGEDVEFINQFLICSADDPPSSTVVNLWISDEIENYYDTMDKELLLRSLTLTMTEYFDITEDDFLLTLQ